jgi:hypothetical protein
MDRRNSLGKKAERPGETAEQVRERAIAYVRAQGHPEFQPTPAFI